MNETNPNLATDSGSDVSIETIIPMDSTDQNSASPAKRTHSNSKLVRTSWILALLWSVLISDVLLFDGGLGWGWAIWATLCAWTLPFARSHRGPWLLASIAVTLLSLRMAWEITTMGALLTLPLLAMSLSRGRVQIFRMPEALYSLIATPFSRFALLIQLPEILIRKGTFLQWTRQFRKNSSSWYAWGFATVLALTFLMMFSQGNPILNQGIARIGETFSETFTFAQGSFNNFAQHLLLALLISWGTLSMIFPKTNLQIWKNYFIKSSMTTSESCPKAMKKEVLAWTRLVLFNGLFLLPNILDIIYLWMGNGLPAGVKFVEYAHEGVMWLTLSVLTASLVFALTMPQHLEQATLKIKLLASFWILQNTCLGMGAIKRLCLYVDYNGLTILRVTGFAGILAVLACLWIVAMSRCGTRGSLWMIRRQCVIALLITYLLVLIPWDIFVARFNVSKINSGMERPSVQLLAQNWGPMSSIELLPLLHTENMHIRRGTAALLLQKVTEYTYITKKQLKDWRLRDFGTQVALDKLNQHREEMLKLVEDMPLDQHTKNLRRYSRRWY